MNTLTIPNVPSELLAQLRDRAAHSGRTVEEEVLSATERGLRSPTGAGVTEEELHVIPSPEIPAPFDPELEGPREPVKVRDGGPLPVEFWYDEDKVAE
jgi:hypothetical protein